MSPSTSLNSTPANKRSNVSGPTMAAIRAVIASDWIWETNMFTSGCCFDQTYAGNLATQVEQPILSFDIVRSRVRIPKLLVKEVFFGNRCCRFVARRQRDLCPVRLVDVVRRAAAAHLGRDPSWLQGVRFYFGKHARRSERQQHVLKLGFGIGLGA